MCIAIIKPRGVKLPTKDVLYNCFMNNPHGIGYVIHRDGYNCLHKGFDDFDKFIEELKVINPKQSESMMIHFRVASVGSINKTNCHPYIVSSDNDILKTLIAKTKNAIAVHNGTFKSFKNNKNGLSDTLQFVKLISPIISNYNSVNDKTNNAMFDFINLYVNDNNSRFAFMDSIGQIHAFGKWIKDQYTNLYFSNESYLKISSRFAIEELNLKF